MKRITFAIIAVVALAFGVQAQVTHPLPVTLLSTNALVGSKALAGPTLGTDVQQWKTVGVQLSCVVSNGGAALDCGTDKEFLYAYLGVGYTSSQKTGIGPMVAGGVLQASNTAINVHTLALRYNTNQAGNGVFQSVYTNIDLNGLNFLWCNYMTNAGTVATLCLTNVSVKLWPNQLR